ncbi:MAG: hypothetical protein RR636_07305 [Clostridium sp.]|uniref:hypothetical protein n=1 Tax=Clostridium sp. TaxID=1506 RepID=UPI003036401F
MVFNKNNKKINLRVPIIVMMTLILFVFIFARCSFIGKKQESNDELSHSNNYTSALIEKNNNIYIYDEDEMYLEGIGELNRFKEFASISQNWENVEFKYVDEKDNINIYNMKNKEYRVLHVDNIGDNQISNVSWMENNIVVELYVNPTTTKYLIYEVENLELVNTCEGILIDVLDDGRTLVYGVNKQGETSIFINEVKVYDLETKGEVLLKGEVSSNGKNLGFITFNYDKEKGEQKEYLYTGEIKDKQLKNVTKVVKPYEINGSIVYENEKLSLVCSDGIYIVEEEKFIKEESELNKKLADSSLKLKNILKNTFKGENINDDLSWQDMGIYNITWFTR